MIRKKGSKWCIVNNDGEIVKCYSVKKLGKTGACNKAKRMHDVLLANSKKKQHIKLISS